MKRTSLTRVLCILLSLLLFASVFPERSQASDVVDVSDMETFKHLMRQDGNVMIRLTANLFEQHGYAKSEVPGGELPLWAKICFPWMMAIDHKSPHYYGPTGEYVGGPSAQYAGDYEYTMPYWLTLGSGYKLIDLQGFSIVVDYPNIYEGTSTMFRIGEGSSLTINDSTGESGYIHYEGYIFDIEDYDINHYYYASDMNRHLFEVCGGSLTINGGTLEAGRSKKQWVTNAHTKDKYGTTDWSSSYTGNVTKSVNGKAVIVNSGSLRINGGILLGRGEYQSVIAANGGSVRIVEGRIDARGSADCLAISPNADVRLVSGVFLLHKNDVVYEGRSPYTETNPYLIHYGTAGKLGFGKDNIDCDSIRASFMDPRPPRHWMLPNSIIEGDGFDLWNEIVAPYGYETFMIIKPVSHEADINFAAAPGKFQPTINTESIVVNTRYTPLFMEAATARGRALYAVCFYDVYEFDTMTLLGHCYTNVNTDIDLCEAMPGLSDNLEEGNTYAVFATVIEQYEGAYPYEVRSVACNLFNATSSKPLTITKQPGPAMYIADGKGGSVTLTAEAANATDAYWEMTQPYYQKLECTSFQNGKAVLTVPVDCEAKYRCQFTNPLYYSDVHETYTWFATDEVEVAYRPAFELRPGQTREQTAIAGYDTAIILFHDGQEDTDGGAPFYGWDYGQANLYAWYKDGEKLTIDGTHYEKAAYWGGGLGLKIKGVTQADAGLYECRCILEEMPFGSGQVDLSVLSSAGWVYNASLSGMGDRHIGDLPPALSTIRTSDIRVGVKSIDWENLDEAGRITADSYYTITLEAKYGALFDEQMTWSMDDANTDWAVVSADGKTAVLEDWHKFPGRGKYEEETDRVVLSQTSFTLYEDRFYPQLHQLRVHEFICPKTHRALGSEHKLGRVSVAPGFSLPWGLTLEGDSFAGELKAAKGVYRVTLRYEILDATSGKACGDCDVDVTFTVLSAGSDPGPEIVHEHVFGNWISEGSDTHYAVCTDCGAKVCFPHEWDEGAVVKSPTKASDGGKLYTCAICAQTRTEVLEYGDYMPPFPEVKDLTVSGDTVTLTLEEYSGSAPDSLLMIAAYDAAGRSLGFAFANPDKSGQVTAELALQGAAVIRVFVVDQNGMIPQTEVFAKTL